MTKAQRILELYDGVRTTNEIAEIVGCLPAYVRVVARQRKSSGVSESDRRYLTSPLGRTTIRQRQKRVWSSGDRAAARNAANDAYRKARELGASSHEAKRKCGPAYASVMRSTGSRASRQGAEA